MIELLDIIGQDEAIAQLQQAMNGKRMPHALLLVGPDGVGRRTTAEALAATLLCERPVTVRNETAPKGQQKDQPDQPASPRPAGRFQQLPEGFPLKQACGTCVDCKMVAAGTHGDFHLVYKELAQYHEDPKVRERVMQDLSIDVIRRFLIAPAGRVSSRGRGKVFIVLEADLMSDAAQNALLKTLEEPPPGVTIILVAERPEQLLPTTLSRCRMVRFGLLPQAFVKEELLERPLPAEQARFWASFTEGSVGRAIALAEAGMYPVKRELLDRLAGLGEGGDAELSELLSDTTEALADDAVKASRKADGTEMARTLATRQATGAMLELIASAFLDAMHLRCGLASGESGLIHADQAQAVKALAQRFSPEQLAEIIQQLSHYEQLLWRNVNPKIVWDNVVITCASAAPVGMY